MILILFKNVANYQYQLPIGNWQHWQHWQHSTRQHYDYGVVTNSVSTYDLLGRMTSQTTPIGITTYFYEGSASRMTRQITVSENITRESVFLYDDCGNQVGVLQDGITTGEFFSTIKEKGLAIETITPAKRTCNEYDDERDALAA